MVDLSKIKIQIGDTFTLDNGSTHTVESTGVDKHDHYLTYMINGYWYTKDGYSALTSAIKQINSQYNVDITKINLGDTVVYRSGHSTKVFQLAYHEDLNAFEVNVQLYQQDGKVNKDYEHRVDIVQVIKGE